MWNGIIAKEFITFLNAYKSLHTVHNSKLKIILFLNPLGKTPALILPVFGEFPPTKNYSQ